jgi:hypothetical protein
MYHKNDGTLQYQKTNQLISMFLEEQLHPSWE